MCSITCGRPLAWLAIHFRVSRKETVERDDDEDT
jgi:hypothetical protein